MMKEYNCSDGYKEVVVDGVRILLHRLIYEQHHNVKLSSTDIIHHIDGNKDNNNITNLKLMTNSEHSKLHANNRNIDYKELRCMSCGKLYTIKLSVYNSKIKNGQTVFVCSKKCVGLLNKKFLYRSPYSEQYERNVKSGLQDGLTGYKIAKKYNMNRATVYNIIKRINDGRVI